MKEKIFSMTLPYPVITEIEEAAPAIPSLWNIRYSQINQNFGTIKEVIDDLGETVEGLSTSLAETFVTKDSATGSALMPFGTTEQRGEPEVGRLRYNTESNSWESGNGVEWSSVGGGGSLGGLQTYLWTGRADGAPEGDFQSSGQQIADALYPKLRAEVLRTQHTLSEGDWQANPWLRITHWSRGDESTWMRPPDKNAAQPGNVGIVYGTGIKADHPYFGSATNDQMRNIHGTFRPQWFDTANMPCEGAFYIDTGYQLTGQVSYATGRNMPAVRFDASRVVPVGDELRPRTFYGVWMVSASAKPATRQAIEASGLVAQLDILSTNIATLEDKNFKDAQCIFEWTRKTESRAFGASYINGTQERSVKCGIYTGTAPQDKVTLTLYINGEPFGGEYGTVTGRSIEGESSSVILDFNVPPNSDYRVDISKTGEVEAGSFFWMEGEKCGH